MKQPVLSVYAQKLLQSNLNLMPTNYQKDNLKALLFLFRPAQGSRLPSQSQTKSPSALSRFLNRYQWSESGLIREQRQIILKQLAQISTGKRKHLPVIIDLSALEKRGVFKGYPDRIHTLNRNRGVQWMVLYLVVGLWRVPWSFRSWRGRGPASPAKLAAKLLRTLPDSLKH